jgi:chemotaxis protein CheX
MAKKKKCILILGPFDEHLDQLRASINSELEKQGACIFFVQAKDGFDASLKAENQKFDAVIIDTEVPRLMEGGFLHNLGVHKNTCESEIFVVSTQAQNELPASLQKAQYLSKPYPTGDLLQGLIKTMMQAEPPSGGTPPKFSVDVRVINAVIKATVHVCQQFGLQNVQMQKPETCDLTNSLCGDVASLMPIRSQSFNGAMIVSFDKQSYLQMLTTMLGEEQSEINADNADAIGEINNIIFGNAKADFTQYGVEMATPKILDIKQKIEAPEGSARMLVPFALEKGKFYLEVIAYPGK